MKNISHAIRAMGLALTTSTPACIVTDELGIDINICMSKYIVEVDTSDDVQSYTVDTPEDFIDMMSDNGYLRYFDNMSKDLFKRLLFGTQKYTASEIVSVLIALTEADDDMEVFISTVKTYYWGDWTVSLCADFNVAIVRFTEYILKKTDDVCWAAIANVELVEFVGSHVDCVSPAKLTDITLNQ